MLNLMRRVPQVLMYVQYTSHLCALRIRTRLLRRCGTSSAAFSTGLVAKGAPCREAHVRQVRIASRRLARENLLFMGDAEPRLRGLLCVGWDEVGEKSYEVAWSGIKALRYGVS